MTQDPSGLSIKNDIFNNDLILHQIARWIKKYSECYRGCMAFNFRPEGCDTPNCPHQHICLHHTTYKLQHPARGCSRNPTKWQSKKKNNNNNNNNYNRRGRGHGRGYYHRCPQYNRQWTYGPQQGFNAFQYQYPPNQGPPGYPGQDPPNPPKNNGDRYFRKPGK